MLGVKSSALCVLLCLGFVIAANAVTVVNKDIKYNEKTQQLRSVNIRDSFMATTVWDLVPAKSGSPRFFYVNITALDGTGETRECRYVLEDDFSMMTAHPEGPHRVLLFSVSTEGSIGEKELEIGVINTADCRIYEEVIRFKSFRDAEKNFLENIDAILINDDRTFDLLYEDAKVCGDKLCKLGVDLKGKIVRGPNPSFAPVAGSHRYVKKEPSSSTFIVTELKPEEAYRISLVKPDGHVVLKEYKSYDDLKDHDVSNADGVIRICSKTNTKKVDCEVFDNNGKSKSKVSVDVPNLPETIAIQNLDEGKFLLLIEDEKTGAAVMKVKGDGSVIGVAKLPDFACNSSSDYESYLGIDGNQACVVRRCSGHENLKVTRECYRDSDFH